MAASLLLIACTAVVTTTYYDDQNVPQITVRQEDCVTIKEIPADKCRYGIALVRESETRYCVHS